MINCGRRFGKTTLAVEEIKGVALSGEKRVAYIAPTYQQARDIAWEILKKELKPVILKINDSRLEIEIRNIKSSSSKIFLRGWESIETLRGQQFDFLVIDEIAMMRNFWLYWQEVLRPTLTDTRGQAMFISTPKGFNHFYKLFNMEREDADFKSFHFTSYDNPYLPKEEIDKAKQELTEDRFAQEYLADFRKTEGLVYKEFDRKIHVFDDDRTVLPQFTEKILGIDFGYTNPACILVIQKDFDGNYWVLDEWYQINKTSEQVAEIASAYKPHVVYPDPENPEAIEQLKRKGLNVRDVIKGKGSVAERINLVRELLKQGRIRISKNCENLIWEMETYRYPDITEYQSKLDKNLRENPVKENDHAVDALGYALSTNSPATPTTEEFNLYTTQYG